MMVFVSSNIGQHPHFEGAGAAYVVALTPKKVVWAAGAVSCGFRDGHTDRPGVGCSVYNCVRSCPERQFDGVQSPRNQIEDAGTSILTVTGRGRMVCPIGGKNPPWGRQNPLFKTVSRHVSHGYFCARIPGASSRLGREGGEYKTLRGNKPACLLTGSEPPATSAVVRSFAGGLFSSHQEGFDMTKHDNAGNLPATLTFQDTELSIIDRDGVPWLIGAEVARALGYASAEEIGKLYRRHKDEFTEAMSLTVKLTGRGHIAPTNHRIYSPRGAQLIAMLAKTDRAKDFRRWVLDVLEKQSAASPAGTSADAVTRPAGPDLMALRQQVVGDVVTLIMDKIGPMIAANAPRTMPPLTKPDDPMPRLLDGHAVFRIGNRMVIVDTNDFDVKRGERAVVLRMEDGEFPQVVTVLDPPSVKGHLDRCKTYESGVSWYLPVGAVLGRVVWEGDFR